MFSTQPKHKNNLLKFSLFEVVLKVFDFYFVSFLIDQNFWEFYSSYFSMSWCRFLLCRQLFSDKKLDFMFESSRVNFYSQWVMTDVLKVFRGWSFAEESRSIYQTTSLGIALLSLTCSVDTCYYTVCTISLNILSQPPFSYSSEFLTILCFYVERSTADVLCFLTHLIRFCVERS